MLFCRQTTNRPKNGAYQMLARDGPVFGEFRITRRTRPNISHQGAAARYRRSRQFSSYFNRSLVIKSCAVLMRSFGSSISILRRSFSAPSNANHFGCACTKRTMTSGSTFALAAKVIRPPRVPRSNFLMPNSSKRHSRPFDYCHATKTARCGEDNYLASRSKRVARSH